jgi:hypothetical protein
MVLYTFSVAERLKKYLREFGLKISFKYSSIDREIIHTKTYN